VIAATFSENKSEAFPSFRLSYIHSRDVAYFWEVEGEETNDSELLLLCYTVLS
jgi:hypothetical protein